MGYSLAMHYRGKGATVLAGVLETPNVSFVIEALENKGIIVHRLDITSERSVQNFRDEIEDLLEERQLGKRRTRKYKRTEEST